MALSWCGSRRSVLLLSTGLVLLQLAGCAPKAPPAATNNDGTPADYSPPGEETAPSGTKRIVILTNGPDPFWDTCEAGAKAAEEELGLVEKGFRVDFQRGDFTEKKQIDMLKQYGLDSDVVAVGISVFNPDNSSLADEMRNLQQKGIKVVTIDSDINREQFRDARYAYLGTDNIVGGRELGRASKAVSPEGAKFAFFVGDLGVANAKERMEGFIEGAGEGFEELTRLSDLGDRGKARKNVEDALGQHPELSMLIGIWAYNCPQIINVVTDRNIRDKTKIVCFDAAEASIQGMANGNVDVMVVQNPFQMGHDGVQLMHALVAGDETVTKSMYPEYAQEGEKDIYRTELRVVVPDAGSAIDPAVFEKDTIFMKFSDFQAWLQERSLISS